jgi:hypothetical protein
VGTKRSEYDEELEDKDKISLVPTPYTTLKPRAFAASYSMSGHRINRHPILVTSNVVTLSQRVRPNEHLSTTIR